MSTALLFDYEQVDNKNYAPVRADERRWAVHDADQFLTQRGASQSL